MADVNIASIFAGRDSCKASCLTRRNAHHPAEWLIGNVYVGSKFAGGFTQFVVVQIWLCKFLT